MAQTGFTPIQIYSSSTTGNTPAAGDLLNSAGGSELAINIFDGKLFYKDNAGAVQVIGWKVVPVSAGGTGQTSYTDGQLLIGNSTGNTLTKATLTAGSGVSITNGAGTITINATGSGGTVTSVGGTGTVNGLTLTGTVTTTGNLTLGGTLDLSSPPTIGNTTANTITGTTITASTKFAGTNYDASSSAGGNLRTASGAACFQWAAGGGVNCTVDGSINMNGANAHIDMSPTGTGHVSINPTGVGDINNVIIGATTPKAITGTTITATTFSGSGASLTSIPNSALVNSTISGVALGGSLFNLTAGTGVSFSTGTTYNGSTAITINATGTGGTVTSVAALTLGTSGTDLSSTVANGTTTPVITLNVPTASAANRGALSAADWTTFNNKYSVGGALGTPSSGTVTNLTGTASININGTVGATTPSTVVATTVTVNGSGASQSLDVQSSTGANAIRIKGRASDGIGSFTFFDTTATTRYGLIQAAPTYFNIAAADTGAYLILTTAGTERMRIPAAGGVQAVTTISVGNATPSASGAGVTFPATQSASTDANTLDDYEEGTWTGTLKGLTTAGNSPTATGTYTKIGRLVMATINFSSVNTTGAAGILAISGLPFANSGTVALSTLVSNTASGSGSRASYATGTNIQALDGVLNDITIVASPVNVFTWASVTYTTST
jgi:hypothetical protein